LLFVEVSRLIFAVRGDFTTPDSMMLSKPRLPAGTGAPAPEILGFGAWLDRAGRLC